MSPNGGDDRDPLHRLSGRPERLWPDAILHHGSRIVLLAGVAALITLLFPPAERADLARYEVGTVADETVQAEVPFEVPKLDRELQRDRAEAAAAVPPTYEYRPSAADSMESRLDRFFERVERAERQSGARGIDRVLADAGISASPTQLEHLADSASRAAVEAAARAVTRELVPRGVVDASQADDITTDRVTVRDREGGERSLAVDSLLIGREFLDRAVGFLGPAPPDLEDLFRLILIRFVEPTYVPDDAATERDREAARSSVPTAKENVLAGQVIVREGDLIGSQEVQRLNAYVEQLRSRGMLDESGIRAAALSGVMLLNVLVLGVYGLVLFFFQSEIYRNFRWVFLQALLVATYFGAAGVIATQGWPAELLPIAFVTLAVAVLWDGRAALILGVLAAALTGSLGPFSDYRVLALTLLGGAAAALSVRVIRRRAQTWIFVAVIGATYAVTILAFALVRGSVPAEVGVDLAWAVGNGTVSAILAMGFIPVFEWVTGITTDQTLLEWADPNRPLLRRLSLEAPGTYAHTINVANIGEAAAGAIGANGLLCRVGIYYHDVGKTLKPQYFVENQPGGRNPHDKLKPDTSASIIREHVVEGLRLAREENVPGVIASFIPEHHGTQKIGFFYEKAKEEYGEENLDPEQFRYPGPKPQSKETAIAMLADSVESATRALQEPTAERVRDLVDNLVDGKIQAGQLDDAPLTLREIAALKAQFVKILSGMYHHRIDYPATRHLTEAGRPEAVAVDAEAAASDERPTGSGPERRAAAGDDTAGPDAAGRERDEASGERTAAHEESPAPRSPERGASG